MMIWAVRFRRALGFGAFLLVLTLLLVPAIAPLFPSMLLSLRDDVGLGWVINRLADVGRASLLCWIIAWAVTAAFRVKNRGA